MRSRMCGVLDRQPPFGKIVYPIASSAKVISLLPRNVAGYGRSWERIPAEEQSCNTASIPASIPMRTVCAIFRFHERLPGGHSTFIMVVGILGSPFSENSPLCPRSSPRGYPEANLQLLTLDTFLVRKRSRNKRQHCRARRPASLQCSIKLVVFEIASSHQHRMSPVALSRPMAAPCKYSAQVAQPFPASLGLTKRRCVIRVGLMIVVRMLLGSLQVCL